MKLRPLLFMAFCIIAGIGIYQIKNKVDERERKLAQIEKSIVAEKDGIHMLSAEWSYLTSPDRLRRMVDKNLELQPIKAHRIISFSNVPDKKPEIVEEEENTPHQLPEGFINSSSQIVSSDEVE